jgi:hypothetical protein
MRESMPVVVQRLGEMVGNERMAVVIDDGGGGETAVIEGKWRGG